VVSGGYQGVRLHVCEELLRNAHQAGHPVIVLHANNDELGNMVIGNGFGTVVNERNRLFDAFTSFKFNEIAQAVLDTCRYRYDIKPAGRYVLQVVHDLLALDGKRPYFSEFASCQYFRLSDQIARKLSSGSITQDESDNLNSMLFTGQSECAKIESFFGEMKSQLDFLLAPDPPRVKAPSVLSTIKNNGILCIDMKSSSNIMLIELVVNSLIIAMNRGYDFSLMLNDVRFVNNEMLKNAVCHKSGHNNIIVSEDLYALTGGKEDVFATVVGDVEKTMLFAHKSSLSCEKWSKYIGEYDKIDVSFNQNSGWSKSSKWGYSSHDGQTEKLQREQKVKPEQIRCLWPDEAFVCDHTSGTLIQTIIT